MESFDDDIIDCILREYDEESFSVFGSVNREKLNDLNFLNTGETIAVFLEIDCNQDYDRKFQMRYNDEVEKIVKISEKEIFSMIDGNASIKYKFHDLIEDVMIDLYAIKSSSGENIAPKLNPKSRKSKLIFSPPRFTGSSKFRDSKKIRWDNWDNTKL